MKKTVVWAAAVSSALLILNGCAAPNNDRDEEMSSATASPLTSDVPMIVTPDPENGYIEDGNGKENGSESRTTPSPGHFSSAIPGTSGNN